MASKTFLDKTGLAYFWGKIKALIPTKTSDITNDSGYITNSDYASAFTGGTVKVTPAFGVEMSGSGELKGRVYDASGYSSMWSDAIVSKGTLDVALADKQDTLVSGTNIKTINNTSLLGSGDISITSGSETITITITDSSTWTSSATWAEIYAAATSGKAINLLYTSSGITYTIQALTAMTNTSWGSDYVYIIFWMPGDSDGTTSLAGVYLVNTGTITWASSAKVARTNLPTIIHYGTSAPSLSTGNNGDIYVVYEE